MGTSPMLRAKPVAVGRYAEGNQLAIPCTTARHYRHHPTMIVAISFRTVFTGDHRQRIVSKSNATRPH